MKLKLLHFQIAAAALLAPAAVSLASTTKPAPAQPATRVAQVIMPAPVAAPAAIAPVTQIAPVTAPTACGPKVRVVYAGYVQPAQKGC